MKILCITPSYFPAFHFGGTISAVHNLNCALNRAGHEVHVYTTNIGLPNVSAGKVINQEGIKVTYFPHIKWLDVFTSSGWNYSPEMNLALKNNLAKFDVVKMESIWNYPTLCAARLCQKLNEPYIITPHGSLYPYTLHKKYFKKKIYYELFIKRILNKAAAIQYTTNDEFKNCHNNLKLRSDAFIVPNGLDFSEFKNLPLKNALAKRYPFLKNKKIILFLGRITEKKGLDLLVRAFAKYSRKNQKSILLIVGNDENGYVKKIEQIISKEEIKDRVLFTGILTGKKKLEAYRGSDVFVLSSYSENFGMTVVEAMTCGLPVIVSDQVGIHDEIKKESAGVIVRCNVGSITRGIASVLENAKLAHELSRKGDNMVKRYYDIDQVAKKYSQGLERIKNRKD